MAMAMETATAMATTTTTTTNSTWSVSHGSLDSCLTLVFLDPASHQPLDIPPSASPAAETLVLLPPPDPVPCEITVKFQRRSCYVESLYILSTARICELYCQTRMESDSEYICTVKGWVPEEQEEASQSSENESRVCTDNTWYSHESTAGDSGLNVEGNLERLGSIVSENDQEELRPNGPLSNEDKFGAESCMVEHEQGVSSIIPVNLMTKNESDSLCVNQQITASSKQKRYEAELELLDQNPWEVITIRFLSLQDKSKVEVDQLVMLVVVGPEIPERVSLGQSAERGSNSEMLAMFLPSMVQMARGVSRDRITVDSLKSESSIQSTRQGMKILEKSADLSPKHEVDEKAGPRLETYGQNAEAQSTESGQTRVKETESRSADKPSESSVAAAHKHPQLFDSSDPLDSLSSRTIFLTLEAFSKRFDRLELLCLRIESYLQSAVERMDQRITLLEERQGKSLKSTDLVDLPFASNLKVDGVFSGEHGCMDMGSGPLPGCTSTSASAERHDGFSTNTSITDGYSEQTQFPVEAEEPMSFERGCKYDRSLEIESTDKEISSNFTSTCEESLREVSPSSGIEPSKKHYRSLDDALMSALAAFNSCSTPVNENSKNLRSVSSYRQFNSTNDLSCEIKQCEIENKVADCKVMSESEDYDLGLQMKAKNDPTCQISLDLELKQAFENEVNTNDEAESLDSNVLPGSGAEGLPNDMINSLSENNISGQMGHTCAGDNMEFRSLVSDDISLHMRNKLQEFGSVGSSSIEDFHSQIVSSSKGGCQDTQTTDDSAADCESIPSEVKVASHIHRLVDDGNKITGAQLSCSCKGTNETRVSDDNGIVVNQKSCSLQVEVEVEKPPYIADNQPTCSETAGIPIFIQENALGNTTVDEDVFLDVSNKHTRETHQCSKNRKDTESGDDYHAGGSCPEVKDVVNLQSVIDAEMLEDDANPDASSESTNNKFMLVDNASDGIVNLLFHTSLQAEAESDESYSIAQALSSLWKSSGEVTSSAATSGSERALIDLDESMDKTCSVLVEPGPDKQAFTGRSIEEEHWLLPYSMNEPNQGTTVFPGFENLTM